MTPQMIKILVYFMTAVIFKESFDFAGMKKAKDISSLIEIFVNGKECSIRVRKKMLLGYEYFTIENISYSGDIKEYVEHEN